jgi:hypothetical protein
LTLVASEALAHSGHGLVGSHPHGWDYALLAIAIVVAAYCGLRK